MRNRIFFPRKSIFQFSNHFPDRKQSFRWSFVNANTWKKRGFSMVAGFGRHWYRFSVYISPRLIWIFASPFSFCTFILWMNFFLLQHDYFIIKNKRKNTYPRMSIIRLNKSNSEAPGNNGSPRNNSATMHPKDHISIAVVYLKKWLRVMLEIVKN